jgi:hypothetical protein
MLAALAAMRITASSMEDGERGKKRERPGTNGEKEVKRRYQLA